MPANIEIKAIVRESKAQRALAEQLAGTSARVIGQVDTFFTVPSGRLKLRELGPDDGELIAYDRPDQPGPKASRYVVARTSDPTSLKACLASALGVRGVVTKKRRLYLVGATRIHFDEVEGLGSFVELEVVLAADQSREQGERTARKLMEQLLIRDEDLIDRAYIDLLLDTLSE